MTGTADDQAEITTALRVVRDRVGEPVKAVIGP